MTRKKISDFTRVSIFRIIILLLNGRNTGLPPKNVPKRALRVIEQF